MNQQHQNVTEKVTVYEVGPRDGLQNESKILTLADKLHFIKLLLAAKLEALEVTSFVRADKIPQMGDAGALMEELGKVQTNCRLIALVPNLKGLELAQKKGVKELALFTATSNSFNQKNINASVEESLDRLRPVAIEAIRSGLKIRGYISTVFGCPYEGKTSPEVLKKVANRLMDFGCYQLSLGDTIGVADPYQVQSILTEMKNHFDLDQMAMHFHDTYGRALANVTVSLQEGIRTFDSSAGGLGGCPYAQGATGNVATEDLMAMLEKMGHPTGIDGAKLKEAVAFIFSKLGKNPNSRTFYTQTAK
jgi:hydroxymethylglutaryl-CoA lyase